MPYVDYVGKYRLFFFFGLILFFFIGFSAKFSFAASFDSSRISVPEINGKNTTKTFVSDDGSSNATENLSKLRVPPSVKNVFEEPDEVLFAPREMLVKALANDREALTRRRPSLRPCTDDFNYSFISRPEFLGSRSFPSIKRFYDTSAQNIVDIGMYSSPVKFLSPWKGTGIILPVASQWKYSRSNCFTTHPKSREGDLPMSTSEEKTEMHLLSLDGEDFRKTMDPFNALRANLPSFFCPDSEKCRNTVLNCTSPPSGVVSNSVPDASDVCNSNEDNALPLPFFFRTYALSHRLKKSSTAYSSSMDMQRKERGEVVDTVIVHKGAVQSGAFPNKLIWNNSSELGTQNSADTMKETIAEENEYTSPSSQKGQSVSIFEKKWPHLIAVDEYAFDEIHLRLSSELYTEYLILFYDEWNVNAENLLNAVEDVARRLELMDNSYLNSMTTPSRVLYSPLYKKMKRQLLHPSASSSESITSLKLGAFAALWQEYEGTPFGEGQCSTTSSSADGGFASGTLATDIPPTSKQKPSCSQRNSSTPWDRVAIPPLPVLKSMYSFSSSDQVPFQNVLQMVLAAPLHLFSSVSPLQREIRSHPQSPAIFFVEEVPDAMTVQGFSPDSAKKDVQKRGKLISKEGNRAASSKSLRKSVFTQMRYTNALRKFSDSCSFSTGKISPVWNRTTHERCRHSSLSSTGTEQLDRFILRHSRSSLFVRSEFVVIHKLLVDYPVVAILTPPPFQCALDSSSERQKERKHFSSAHLSSSSSRLPFPSFIHSWNEEDFYTHLRMLRKIVPTFLFVPNASTSCSHIPIWLSRSSRLRDVDPLFTTTATAGQSMWKPPFEEEEDILITPFQPTIDLRQFDAVLPHQQKTISLSTLAPSTDRAVGTGTDWTLTVLSRVTPVMESSNHETASSLFPKRCFDSASPTPSFSRRSSTCRSFIKQDIIFPSFLEGVSSHSFSDSCLRVNPASRPPFSSLQPFLMTLVDVLQDTIGQWPVREVRGDSFEELLQGIFYPVHKPFALLSHSNFSENRENNNSLLNRPSQSRHDGWSARSSFAPAGRTNAMTPFRASRKDHFLFPQLYDSRIEEVIIVLHPSTSSFDAPAKMEHKQEVGGAHRDEDRKEEKEEKMVSNAERSKQRKFCSWAIHYIAASELHQGRNLYRRFLYVDDDAEELHVELEHAAEQGSTSSSFCSPASRPAALPSFCRVYCITREEKLVKLETQNDLFFVKDRNANRIPSAAQNTIRVTNPISEMEGDLPFLPEGSTPPDTTKKISLSSSTSAALSAHTLPCLFLPSPEMLKVALKELANRFTALVGENVPCKFAQHFSNHYRDSNSLLEKRSCLYKHIDLMETKEKNQLVGNVQGIERWEKKKRKEMRSLLHCEAILSPNNSGTLLQSSPSPALWFLWIPEGKATPVVMYELVPTSISTWTASPPTTQQREFIQSDRESLLNNTTWGPSLQVVFVYDSSCGLSSNYLKALKLIASCYPSSFSSSAFFAPHDAGSHSNPNNPEEDESHNTHPMRNFFFLDLLEVDRSSSWNEGLKKLFYTHSDQQGQNRENEKKKDVVTEGMDVLRKLLLPSFFEDPLRLHSPLLLVVNRTMAMTTLPTVSYIEEDRWLDSILDLILLMEQENPEYHMTERRNHELHQKNTVNASLAVSSPYKEHIRSLTWKCLDDTFQAEGRRRQPYREALHHYLKNGKQKKSVMKNISGA